MKSAPNISCLRQGVSLRDLAQVVALRLEGASAFALLDRMSTAPIYVREGQIKQSLFLLPDGKIFADILIASGGGGFFVLSEGPSREDLLSYISTYGGDAALQTSIVDLSEAYDSFGVGGPFAWEFVRALLGPTVLGMGHLTLIAVGPERKTLCFRTGMAGEYGYCIFVPKNESAHVRETLSQLAAQFDLETMTQGDLELAAVEQGIFNISLLNALGSLKTLGPIELQLQSRVGFERSFVGAESLNHKRLHGTTHRTTSFSAASLLAEGSPILLEGVKVGTVLVTRQSPCRGDVVGLCLLEKKYAHPGIDAFFAHIDEGLIQIFTKTPPLLTNRSLAVNSLVHAYATRSTANFPPLVIE